MKSYVEPGKSRKVIGNLTADPERAKALFGLVPAEVLSQINALGNDFTLDEINEFGQVVRDVVPQGELDADALDNVAGGLVITAALAGACVVAAGAGWAVGCLFGSNPKVPW